MQHLRPEQIAWENPVAEQYLRERGGSKNGSREFLRDTKPGLQPHLPHGDYLSPEEQDIERFLDTIDFTRGKVVRACLWLDVFGVVDATPTKISNGREETRKIIFELLAAAHDPSVGSYIEYESGKPFDKKIGILVQDYCGEVGGSILEHPHERGIFHVAKVVRNPSRQGEDAISESVYDESGYMLDEAPDQKRGQNKRLQADPDSSVPDIIALYKKIRESGLFPSSWSFQMEYGYDTKGGRNALVQFYQARLFRPYSPAADFDLAELIHKKCMLEVLTARYGTYGVTPVGGLVVPCANLSARSSEKFAIHPSMAYIYDTEQSRQASTPLKVQPKNMSAYLAVGTKPLEHGNYRWIQKANVALTGMNEVAIDIGEKNLAAKDNLAHGVRIYSDGFIGGVEILK